MTIIANASTVCQTLSALHILIHLIQQFNDGSPVLYFSNKGTEAEMGQTTPDCIANRWWSQNASFKSQNCHMTQHDPAIPLLGIHTEETRTERDTCTPMFITALFIIAKTWKQPRCSSADEWIRKLWYIYTMEYYSAIEKNTFESILMRWMKLEPIIQSEENHILLLDDVQIIVVPEFKDTCTPMFIAALFTIAKTWKQPRYPSIDEWIKKLWHVYIMEYYFIIKRNKFESV